MEKLYQFIEREFGSDESVEGKYAAVHIICGESAAGSLRVGLSDENKVIGFPDFFAVGPLWRLHTDEGRKRRYEWLQGHYNIEIAYLEKEYESKFSKALEEVEAIPKHIPIVIWTGDNAGEQVGLHYFSHLLKEKTNDIYLINATTAYQELFNTSKVQYLYIHTGEMVSEEFNLIFQKKLSVPLLLETRKQFLREWKTLSETTEVLRIWQDDKIKSVSENYFDQLIIRTAKKLHGEQREQDFIQAGMLIGELLGNLENHVGDTFLEYRIRNLINNGVFEIKGNLKSMRHYSVKLR